jgi:hypothetical protein
VTTAAYLIIGIAGLLAVAVAFGLVVPAVVAEIRDRRRARRASLLREQGVVRLSDHRARLRAHRKQAIPAAPARGLGSCIPTARPVPARKDIEIALTTTSGHKE